MQVMTNASVDVCICKTAPIANSWICFRKFGVLLYQYGRRMTSRS